MHQSSYDKMKAFTEDYLGDMRGKSINILDIGSQDVNGSYRAIFDDDSWQYQGLDMAPGKNVDVLVDNPYSWKSIKSNSKDVVVSGQALEHVEFFWITMMEIVRVLKPGGVCCILAPAAGVEHRYPVDCWRFYPDGFSALARYVGLETLKAETQWEPLGYTEDDSDDWKDSILIARKPVLTGMMRLKTATKVKLLRRLAEPRF